MKGFRLLVSISLSFCLSANASLITFSGEPVITYIEGEIEVPVFPKATVTLNGQSYEVFLTGSGIRTKKVLFFREKVYVAANYIDNLDGISAETPLDSIGESQIEVFQLTTLIDLTAQQIRSQWEDSLDYNGVDVEAPEVASLFDQMEDGLMAGAVNTAVSFNNGDGTETVIIEQPNVVLESTGQQLGLNLWKIWFGKPLDEGLSKLKPLLIGK